MKKYIILTGGGLSNKGAQAMTYICVNELFKRYPEYQVVLLSDKDARRSNSELKKYNFLVLPELRFREKIILSNKICRMIFYSMVRNDRIRMFVNIYKNTNLVLDISGYALGSNWGNPFSYTLNVLVAKAFNIPIYLMPQSFGPFDYKGKFKFVSDWAIKHSLKHVELIMGREDEGVRLLKEKYHLTNVIKTYDMVLQSSPIENYNVIFKGKVDHSAVLVEKNSVALIPSKKIYQYLSETRADSLYSAALDALLMLRKTVYLLYHSKEDYAICRKLKAMYADNDNVRIIDKELSCIEYCELVEAFDYIVASRYHSIIHSYKKQVPAVIIGWAIKYNDLALAFSQERYSLDIRTKVSNEELTRMINDMEQKHLAEKKVIANKLIDIERENVFSNIIN